MGKILSVATKPFRNFNLESRAHKAISQEKRAAAPKYKSDSIDFEKLLKDNPEMLKESLKKHEKLDTHLKDVFVVSHDLKVEIPENKERALPLNRTSVEEFEYGFKEPDKVPVGKATLRSIIKFIGEHQAKPKEFNAKKIAEQYSLSEDSVRNILKYCRVFEVYVPVDQKKKAHATFAGPSIPRTIITTVEPKKLSAGDEDKT